MTLLRFDGSLSDVALVAAQRCARERIQPALAAVPGRMTVVGRFP